MNLKFDEIKGLLLCIEWYAVTALIVSSLANVENNTKFLKFK